MTCQQLYGGFATTWILNETMYCTMHEAQATRNKEHRTSPKESFRTNLERRTPSISPVWGLMGPVKQKNSTILTGIGQILLSPMTKRSRQSMKNGINLASVNLFPRLH